MPTTATLSTAVLQLQLIEVYLLTRLALPFFGEVDADPSITLLLVVVTALITVNFHTSRAIHDLHLVHLLLHHLQCSLLDVATGPLLVVILLLLVVAYQGRVLGNVVDHDG